jgi:hypothetical protein
VEEPTLQGRRRYCSRPRGYLRQAVLRRNQCDTIPV